MLETLLKEFVFMWTVVDPIGTVPVFIAATAGRSAVTQRRIALRAVIVAAAVLVFFILAGRVLLHAMSIEISAFQIAGGIIMFLFALQMIFGTSKPSRHFRWPRRPPRLRWMSQCFPWLCPQSPVRGR